MRNDCDIRYDSAVNKMKSSTFFWSVVADSLKKAVIVRNYILGKIGINAWRLVLQSQCLQDMACIDVTITVNQKLQETLMSESNCEADLYEYKEP